MSDEIEVRQEIEVVKPEPKQEIEPQKYKAIVEYHNGMVQLKTLEESFRFATVIHQAGTYSKRHNSVQKIMIVIQAGAEVGLPPIASLKNIAIIGDIPCIWGDAIPGIVLSRGTMTEFDERVEGTGDDLTGICHVKRVNGLERTERFSMADARKAGLATKPGTWQQYPKKMLVYRARAFAFRAIFADCLCGLSIAEEVSDYPTRRPDIIEGNGALNLEGK